MSKSLNELKQVLPGAEDDPTLVAISDELDIADDLALFINTPSGQKVVAKLKGNAINGLTNLFELAKTAELGPLLSAIARLEQTITMLRRFLGAKSDADALLDLLKEKASQK